MSIGNNIKRLRREKDITQERLAEYLGITSRAVSQWESDRTAPDISQLPVLCHIFDVSADVILGIDVIKRDEEIRKYLGRAIAERDEGRFEDCVSILREAYKKYPKSYKIIWQLADTLVSVYSRKGIKDYEEVYELCGRILSECTESTLRYEAMNTLAVAYGYAGKNEEMFSLAQQMPKSRLSYESFMLYRWQGDADLEKLQEYIAYLLKQLMAGIGRLPGYCHDDGGMIYTKEDIIRLNKLQVDLLELIYPCGDYQYCAQYGEIACSRLVDIYLTEKDNENAWIWLEKGADFAIHADTYDFNAPHTSTILRGYSDGGWIVESFGNRSQSILNWLTTADEAKAMRSDARYDSLVNRLEKAAKKP